MPEGVDVAVEGGFATIEFVDKTRRGPGLAALLAVGGPELIEKVTRPRLAYIVPEGNARAAGLLDSPYATGGAVPAAADGTWTELAAEDTGGPYTILPEIENPDGTTPLEPVKAWPAGEPADDWRRDELDAYAAAHGIDTLELPNKAAALAAIQEAS